jgi:capsular polysaccharide biosynthesis protein
MDLITILRALWRGRLLVVLATFVAVLAGLVVAYRVTPGLPPKLESRQYQVALGTVNVLVDTPDSQVIDLSPTGADAVSTRATLLASLISTSPIKDEISRRVGIPSDRLVVLGPQAGEAPASPSGTKAAVAADGRRANIISIRTDETLPVISIDTQAPTGEEAIRLANGAAAGLQDYLATVVRSQKVPLKRRLVLRTLGTPEVGVSVRGPRKAYGVVLAFFLLVAFCAAIVILPGIARALRAAAAEERAEKERRELRAREEDDYDGFGSAVPPRREDPATLAEAPADSKLFSTVPLSAATGTEHSR